MSILLDQSNKIIIQGITGDLGIQITKMLIRDETNIVGGVSPNKGGEWVLEGKIPVFETVRSAIDATEANTSIIVVPPLNATEAIFEAFESGISLVVCISSGIPVQEMVRVRMYLEGRNCRLIGPGSPGLCIPDEISVGILPHTRIKKGKIGVVSRSSTLAFQIMDFLCEKGLGISAFVGMGDAPISGTDMKDVLGMFEEDSGTDIILLVGEQGGFQEENAAKYFSQHITKPMIGYIAGQSGLLDPYFLQNTLFSRNQIHSVNGKIAALKNAGVKVALTINEIPGLLKSASYF
jgi:succinyl-CoA synthetase alpha subunit